MKRFFKLNQLSQRGFVHHLMPIVVVLMLGSITGGFFYYKTQAAQPWNGALQVGPSGSGWCMEAPVLSERSTIKLNKCANTVNQKWQLMSAGTVSVGGKTYRAYTIETFAAGKFLCVDDYKRSTAQGANNHLVLWSCNGVDSAQRFFWTGDGHQLRSQIGINYDLALCIDNERGQHTAGNPIDLYKCWQPAHANQDWFEVGNSAKASSAPVSQPVKPPSGGGTGGPTTASTTGGCSYGGTAAPCVGGVTAGASGWGKPVFDDEFNGTSLNTKFWYPNWFNGRKINSNGVSFSPSNVSVSGGVATLKLSSSSVGANMVTDPSQVSGGGFQFGTGYYAEARLYLPGSGTSVYDWPAFWTDGQHWPTTGESDIVEGLGSATSNYHSTSGASNSGTIAGTWSNSWHTYALDRESGKDYVYWDGKLVRSYASNDGGAPQFLLLTLDCSGGCKTGTAYQLKADYVRVWKK